MLLVQGGTATAMWCSQHLTVTGGRTTGDYERRRHPADGYTTLTLDHATVSGNSTAGDYAGGGGISGFT